MYTVYTHIYTAVYTDHTVYIAVYIAEYSVYTVYTAAVSTVSTEYIHSPNKPYKYKSVLRRTATVRGSSLAMKRSVLSAWEGSTVTRA